MAAAALPQKGLGQGGPTLTKQQAVEAQELFIVEYSKESFQTKLKDRWRETAGDPKAQEKVRQELCLPLQGQVLSRYGFSGSRSGVLQALAAFSQLEADADVAMRNRKLAFLTNPDVKEAATEAPKATAKEAGAGESPSATARAPPPADPSPKSPAASPPPADPSPKSPAASSPKSPAASEPSPAARVPTPVASPKQPQADVAVESATPKQPTSPNSAGEAAARGAKAAEARAEEARAAAVKMAEAKAAAARAAEAKAAEVKAAAAKAAAAPPSPKPAVAAPAPAAVDKKERSPTASGEGNAVIPPLQKYSAQDNIPTDGQIWVVTGGGGVGGIVVRKNKEVASPDLGFRLQTGARVEELELIGDRLHYKRLQGDGPDFGWVSVSFKGSPLLMQITMEEFNATASRF